MEKNEQIEKYRNRAVNVILIIVALVISSNIYKANQAKVEELKGKIAEEQKKNDELSNIKKLDSGIKSYRKILAEKDDSVSMNEINSIAKDNEIKILSIKPSAGLFKPDYRKSSFDVNVSAPTYNSLVRFVNAVESYKSFYTVDGLEIVNKTEDKDEEGLKANMRISAVVALNQ